MQTILSKDNPKLKAVRALLRSKKERQEASAFVMEGLRALSALTDGSALPGYQLREIWVAEDAAEQAASFSVPVYAVPRTLMDQLTDCCSSQGVLGVVTCTPQPLSLRPDRGNYLLLDGLSDPGNLGTLIRSAVAFGFDGVFLYGDTVEVFNPKTIRSTMGTLPFCRYWSVGDAFFEQLKDAGYDLIATALHEGEPLPKMCFGPKNVLVIGNEAHGVSPDLLRRASRRLSIPMSGKAESLNAAVAGSICMYAIQVATG